MSARLLVIEKFLELLACSDSRQWQSCEKLGKHARAMNVSGNQLLKVLMTGLKYHHEQILDINFFALSYTIRLSKNLAKFQSVKNIKKSRF